tara:strand:+ start:117 stop:485 length:369 start_codon:yes stop_codon:yes gene_type:complete
MKILLAIISVMAVLCGLAYLKKHQSVVGYSFEGMGKEEAEDTSSSGNIKIPIPGMSKAPSALKFNEDEANPNSASKCTPCPPCGRCPEPAFECKKVPTYSALSHMPQVPEAVLETGYSTYAN